MAGNVNDSIKESFGAVGSDIGQRVILTRSDTWKDPVANVAALPPSGNTAGDARITLSTSILYSWNGTAWVAPSGAGSGTVTSVSITTANGISGTVATNSTTPAITLTLGAITPTSVNSVVISGTATPTLAVTGSVTVSGSHSGTNTGDNATNSLYSSLVTNQTHTGDATGATALTLATVNANVGTFGSATFSGVVTVNAKGLVTGASNVTIQIAEAQVTNLITDLAGKQGTIAITTTGTSGAATLIGNTLNIPQYTGGGGGSVTSVSVITGNGISGSVATATTTPAITLTLGAITPTSIVSSGNHQALRIGINQANSGTAMIEVLNSGSLQGFRIENNLATNIGFSAFVTGDTQVRVSLLASGLLQWGPGGATVVDTNLYRSAVSTLTTDSKFEARGGLRIGTTGTTVGHVFTVTDTVGNATFQAPTGGGGVSYTEVTGTSQTIAVNTGYILNNAALVTATLPSTSAVGNIVRVVGKGAGGWRIAQPAGVNIRFIDIASTTGVGGSVSSTASYDSVELVCTTANTTWTVASAVGNLTIL